MTANNSVAADLGHRREGSVAGGARRSRNAIRAARTAGQHGSAIRDAVRRVNVVQLEPSLVRMLVFWLGKYAELAEQRYGSKPEGVVEVQSALAEAYVAGDSRQHEQDHRMAPEAITSGCDSWIGTAEAAEILGCTADNVRDHRRRGNLESRQGGRPYMISVASVERLKARLTKRKGA